jgi:hypothetical protein
LSLRASCFCVLSMNSLIPQSQSQYESGSESEPQSESESQPEFGPFCVECHVDTSRIFHKSGECPECFVDRLDGVLEMLDARRTQYLNGSNRDVERHAKRIKSKRAFILQTGGTSKKRDTRLFDQLIESLEELDSVLPELEDEQEWLPEKIQKV